MPSLIDKSGHIAYFGRFTLGNLVDWMVTFCLGGIIILMTVSLGGVRPDTHLGLIPLFGLLLGLHGLWLAVDSETPKRISHVPFFFVPFVLWMVASAVWFSPTAWLGVYEVILALEIFIFAWVFVNNVRTRAHLWVVIILALFPAAMGVFNGFYQFFQDPNRIADANGLYQVVLSAQYLGQATGTFADPNAYALYLLVLLPAVIVAAAVPRLPVILRILAAYIAVMLVAAIVFAQVIWALPVCLFAFVLVSGFCYRRFSHRLYFMGAATSLLLLAVGIVIAFSPGYWELLLSSASTFASGERMALWKEVVQMIAANPITGGGAGSFGMHAEQSSTLRFNAIPEHAHSDVLQVFADYGLIGGVLFFGPVGMILYRAFRRLKAEPSRVKLRDIKALIMPPQRFFLSVGLGGAICFGVCLCVSFALPVPALGISGACFLMILVKTSFNRKLIVPSGMTLRLTYLVLSIAAGVFFALWASPLLESRAVELHARQRLDQLVGVRAHMTGNDVLMDEVIANYELAVELSPANTDGWIGLSAAYCQLFFRVPETHRELGVRAAECAQQAVQLSGEYWRAWAQLGVSQALAGNYAEAETALSKALELAPNSSHANYQWAAFTSSFPERYEEALDAVRQSLAIDPDNAAARRLEQKLLIL